MRAWLTREFGGIDALTLEDAPSQPVGDSEIRIRVRACGLNFADTLILDGKYQVRPPFPFGPGLEVAGEVIEAAPDVTGLLPGKRVLAVADFGGCAEEIVVPAHRVVTIPDVMDFETAAAFAVAYGTSHVALRYKADLQAGETLLVHGASGGVGLTAVEIGKHIGARVIATASSDEKLEVARSRGADDLINASSLDVREVVKDLTKGRGADVIYDPVGGSAFEASLRCIAFEGRIIVIGFASGTVPQIPANLVLVKNIDVLGLYWGAYLAKKPAVIANSFHELMAWYADGAIKPHISHRYAFADAPEALRTLASRKATGKIVLNID